MFGYVRPLKGELKVREFEQFKAEYCGLCHVLLRDFGRSATLLLNYDLVILAMLLDPSPPAFRHSRCMASPLKKKCVCSSGAGLEHAARCCVILSYHKLRDNVVDEGFFRGLPARFASFFVRRAYRKAKAELPEFDALVAEKLKQLEQIETERPDSIDIPADCFANILAGAAEGAENERVLKQLLYHMGRWIYILDAFDDLRGDMAEGRFNPIAQRFGLTVPEPGEPEKNTIVTTLGHSEHLMSTAFELLPAGFWTGHLTNILYLGMPAVAKEVLAGTWRKKRDRRPD